MKRKREVAPQLSAFAARRQAAAELEAQKQAQAIIPDDESDDEHNWGDSSPTSSTSSDRVANKFAVLGTQDTASSSTQGFSTIHESRTKQVANAEIAAAFSAKLVRMPGELLLGLVKGERIAIQGYCKLRVRAGAIIICGATLLSGPNQYIIAAPKSENAPIISACTGQALVNENFEEPVVAEVTFSRSESRLIDALSLYPISKGTFGKSSNVGDESIPVWLRPPTIFSHNLSRSWKNAMTLPIVSCTVVIGPKNVGKSTLARHLLNTSLCKPVASPQEEGGAHITVKEDYDEEGNTRKTFQSSVYFLDLDPGQPEFSVPGTISLYHCPPHHSPQFSSAAFGESMTPLRSHWIGETSPKEDPSHYLSCMHDLVQTCRRHQCETRASYEHASAEHQDDDDDMEHDATSTLLVNTPGWMKGTGLDLLCATIETLSRTLDTVRVLHLSHGSSSDFHLSIPNVEIRHVNAFRPCRTTSVAGNDGPDAAAAEEDDEDPPGASVRVAEDDDGTIDPSVGAEFKTCSARSAVDKRTINLLSYFHRRPPVLPPQITTNSTIQPSPLPINGDDDGGPGGGWHANSVTHASWTIATAAIPVVVTRECLAVEELVHALNGTVVALLAVQANYLAQACDSVKGSHGLVMVRPRGGEFGAPLDPRESRSLGLAIVHGLDLARMTISLITPLALDSLAEVLREQGEEMVICTGSIEVPVQLLTRQFERGGPERPYVTDEPGQGIGWQSWHVRRNIGRRVRNG